jgi:DNA-directed RNA polymerase subunit M/transcription elongation factor TFIIS
MDVVHSAVPKKSCTPCPSMLRIAEDDINAMDVVHSAVPKKSCISCPSMLPLRKDDLHQCTWMRCRQTSKKYPVYPVH